MGKYKQYIGLSSGDILALSSVENDSYSGGHLDTEDIIALINSPIIKSKFRIFILYPDETINYEIPSMDIGEGGSYSENYQDGQRRSLSFSLLNDTGKYTPGINSLWAGTRVRLEQGVVSDDGSTVWFWKGVYVINNVSSSVSLSVPITQISATDKFGLFENKTGTLDSTYTIPVGSAIKDIIKDVLLHSSGDGDPFDSQEIIYHPSFEGKTVQAEISKTEGDTFGSILKEMATQLSAEIFYNSMGRLTLTPLNEVSNDSDKPLVYEFRSDDGDFSELNFAYNLEDIINRVIVIGKTNTGATYRAVAVNDNPESPFCYQRIGYRTGSTINDSNITTQYLADERAEYELRKQLMLKTTSSLTVAINPLLAVNNLISLTNEFFNLSHERFLIQGVSFNLGYSGTCSINITNLNNIFTKSPPTGSTEVNFEEDWTVRKLNAPTLFYNDKKQEIYWKDDLYAEDYDFYVNGTRVALPPSSRYEGGMNTLKVIPLLMAFHSGLEDMTLEYVQDFITIIAKGDGNLYSDSSPSNGVLVTKWFAKIPEDLWQWGQNQFQPMFIGAKRIMKRKMARRRGGNLWNWGESVEYFQSLPENPQEGDAYMVTNQQMGYVFLNGEWQICLTRHQVPRRYCLKDPGSIPVTEDEDNPLPDDIKTNYFSGVVYYIQNRKEYVKLIPVLSAPDENENTTILKYKWEKYILPSSKKPFNVNRNFSYSLGVPHLHNYIDLKSPKVKQTGKTKTTTGDEVKRQDIIAERQTNEKGYVPHNSVSTRSFDVNDFHPLRFQLTRSEKKSQTNKKLLYYSADYEIADITPLILNAVLYDNYKNFSMNKSIYRQSYNRNRTEGGQNFWYRDVEIYLNQPSGWENEPEEERYIKLFEPSVHVRVLSSYPKTETILERIHLENGYVITCSDPVKKKQRWGKIDEAWFTENEPEEVVVKVSEDSSSPEDITLYKWTWEREEEGETIQKIFYSKEDNTPKTFYKTHTITDNLITEKRARASLESAKVGSAFNFSPAVYYMDCSVQKNASNTKWTLTRPRPSILNVRSSESDTSNNLFTVESSCVSCGVGIPFNAKESYSSSAEKEYEVGVKITSNIEDLPIVVRCLFFRADGTILSVISKTLYPDSNAKQTFTITVPWDQSLELLQTKQCLLVFCPGWIETEGDTPRRGTSIINPFEPPGEGGGGTPGEPYEPVEEKNSTTQSRTFKVALYSICQKSSGRLCLGGQEHGIRWSRIVDVK